MFRSIGFPELVIILMVFVLPFLWAKILSKAGYSAWLAVTFCIPIINIIVFVWFAFSEWPIRSELMRLRLNAPGNQT